MGTLNEIFTGLGIFIQNGHGADLLSSEHDVIYGPHKDVLLLSIAELEMLEENGWGVDTNLGYWRHYC